ncbi:DUF397 domain-containing protein [Nocardia sp. NBC_00511]|uniref:DUF397 domain-containing protein n=1 Tax=Nocardia sp. NBC_00511 TaxID=2903591 RepID=UPI0030DFD342
MTGELSEAQWFKSTYSSAGQDCVEVAMLANDTVGVRDSKNPSGPALVFAPGMWDAFTTGIRDGRFDQR